MSSFSVAACKSREKLNAPISGNISTYLLVSYSGRGECADPVNEDAILERVGAGPRAGIGSVS